MADIALLKKALTNNPQALALFDLHSSMVAFDRKLQGYTESKCAFERNMDTCVLEYLYYSTKSRAVIDAIKQCQESKCIDDSVKCKETCVKEEGVKRFELLKDQVTAMIEVSKREI